MSDPTHTAALASLRAELRDKSEALDNILARTSARTEE